MTSNDKQRPKDKQPVDRHMQAEQRLEAAKGLPLGADRVTRQTSSQQRKAASDERARVPPSSASYGVKQLTLQNEKLQRLTNSKKHDAHMHCFQDTDVWTDIVILCIVIVIICPFIAHSI